MDRAQYTQSGRFCCVSSWLEFARFFVNKDIMLNNNELNLNEV